MVDRDDIKTYLRIKTADTSRDTAIDGALVAETAAQSRVCRVPVDPAARPADLDEALRRRVARNLALRPLPLAVLTGDAESGNLTLPGRDPEVRRLEAPWRRMVVG